jgi:hypothetical protein
MFGEDEGPKNEPTLAARGKSHQRRLVRRYRRQLPPHPLGFFRNNQAMVLEGPNGSRFGLCCKITVDSRSRAAANILESLDFDPI